LKPIQLFEHLLEYPMKKCTTMAEIREEIDRVDRDIVPLLVERLGYIKQAGFIKKDRDTVRDNWRIEDVISKVIATSKANAGDEKMTEDLYRFLIEWSINHEFDVFDALEELNKKAG